MIVQLLTILSLLLASCSTAPLQTNIPTAPSTLEEAQKYVATRAKTLNFLEYELNEHAKACYDKFFVSDCLDDVRSQGSKIRRAHMEVQGQAQDMIRLHHYARRQAKKPQSTEYQATESLK